MESENTNRSKIILIFALVIGGGLSLFASSYPDGLEKVALAQGFLEKTNQSGVSAKTLEGIIGTLFVFAILFLAGKLLYRKR